MPTPPNVAILDDHREFIEHVRSILRPLSQSNTKGNSNDLSLIDQLRPILKQAPEDLDTVLLFQLATMQDVSPLEKLDAKGFLTHARDRVSAFCAKAKQLEQSLNHAIGRSEEHTSELQSLMRISYAVYCLKKKITKHPQHTDDQYNQPIHTE